MNRFEARQYIRRRIVQELRARCSQTPYITDMRNDEYELVMDLWEDEVWRIADRLETIYGIEKSDDGE